MTAIYRNSDVRNLMRIDDCVTNLMKQISGAISQLLNGVCFIMISLITVL